MPVPGEQTLHRRDGANAHAGGLAARRRPADEPAHGIKVQLGQLVFAHHQAGGGGVVLLAGVSGGDHPALFDGAQLAQALGGRVGADAFVLAEEDRDRPSSA